MVAMTRRQDRAAVSSAAMHANIKNQTKRSHVMLRRRVVAIVEKSEACNWKAGVAFGGS